ncbi:ATP-grasp domain-containing protein [Lysinibacillus odysseyi]|uniref:Carbamoyl-phosphate-synthetase n=1 Tax=Lysinibacillus odysseyi 34hs-1 = NBRC 100172 TaxID=1220589 RepID=A0A0A3JHM0_9BACI|nr:ATP-grasp domain-containing protein [Lysinibacillus odysseyi]KGR86512.1 carbamoyl-phosphate-synthetase [Lysinibacillus odysseyi 34hs-1 = NBRC 100172]
MKKLLVLSGDSYHVPFIKKAKEMGCYVITCDFFEHNPGHQFADEYHNVSYMDKEAVLALAKTLEIDGIICFAADEAATTVAYVAERMGLPSHPYQSIEIINRKDLFRAFLKKHHFQVPKAKSYTSIEKAQAEFHLFKMPVMIKPVDSSGSRGISKIDSVEFLPQKIEYALQHSKVKRFLIEEYIEKQGYQVGGDGFSVDGELVFRYFSNNHLSNTPLNPFVPLGGSWPSILPAHLQNKIHDEIQRLLNLLQMRTGAYNFDIRIDQEENVYFIEMGARNGGNLIPRITNYATGFDLIEYSIKAAIGEDCRDVSMAQSQGYWSCYTINSQKSGIFKGLEMNEEFMKRNVVEYELFVKPGDKIQAFTGSDKKLGSMVLTYSSIDEMLEKMDNMENWIKVIVEESLVNN